jgi:hypothetical protein
MIPKSGHRFSEKIMLKQEPPEARSIGPANQMTAGRRRIAGKIRVNSAT